MPGRFLEEIEAGLQLAGVKAKEAICFVQGNCPCWPELCCCRAAVSAVHLTYLNISQLRGLSLLFRRAAGPLGFAMDTSKCPTG